MERFVGRDCEVRGDLVKGSTGVVCMACAMLAFTLIVPHFPYKSAQYFSMYFVQIIDVRCTYPLVLFRALGELLQDSVVFFLCSLYEVSQL